MGHISGLANSEFLMFQYVVNIVTNTF